MAVYVREGLHVVAVDLPSQLEAVGVEIHLPKKRRVCVLAVYRFPSGDLALSDFIRTLDSTLDNLVHSAKRLLCVVGDFNAKSPNR